MSHTSVQGVHLVKTFYTVLQHPGRNDMQDSAHNIATLYLVC